MSESTTDTYTVSAKTGEHYGAALVVVRGDTPEELAENLNAITGTVVDAIVAFEAGLVAARGLNGPPPAKAQQQTQQQQAAPVHEVKYCNHGERTYKSGTNSRGKWEGWMCPQPKNAADKCEAIWG